MFDKFIQYVPMARGANPETVKINKAGKMQFNKSFLVQNKLNGQRYIQLFYSREDKQILIKFSAIKTDSSMAIGKETLLLTCERFFKSMDIKFEPDDYKAKKIDESVFLIQL